MINIKKLRKLSIVVAFTLVLGFTACSEGKETSSSNTTEQNTEQPTAGVTSKVSSCLVENNSITAGVTSELLNQTYISSIEADVVTAAQDDGTYCGYENLGIANITEGNLNVRKKAEAGSEVVGKMTKHNACEILDEEDGWYRIKSGKVTGYVSSEYIITGEKALEIAKEEVQDIATIENTQTLRIRSEADTEASTVQLIGLGEELVVTEVLDGWYKVDADDDKEGYISADYASVTQKLPTAKTYSEVKYGDGVSDVRVSLVQYALQFVGNRYVWGGTSLTNGVDCSGFTMQVYAHYGIFLPHHAASQPGYGRKIKASEARPGDLFFYGHGRIGHVGIYIGGGQIVHAANKKSGIKISNAYYSTPVCVVSYLN